MTTGQPLPALALRSCPPILVIPILAVPIGTCQPRRSYWGWQAKDSIVTCEVIEVNGGKVIGVVLNKRKMHIPKWAYRSL